METKLKELPNLVKLVWVYCVPKENYAIEKAYPPDNHFKILPWLLIKLTKLSRISIAKYSLTISKVVLFILNFDIQPTWIMQNTSTFFFEFLLLIFFSFLVCPCLWCSLWFIVNEINFIFRIMCLVWFVCLLVRLFLLLYSRA